jgi:hypothetical protein
MDCIYSELKEQEDTSLIPNGILEGYWAKLGLY